MNLSDKTTKEIGDIGEKAAKDYLRKKGFTIVDSNVRRKLGEIDIVARKQGTLHFVEVKALTCRELPETFLNDDRYDPSMHLHEAKVRKVARMSEWYVYERGWEGEWQVDGLLIWLRLRDGASRVEHLEQLV